MDLSQLKEGGVVTFQTQNTLYTITRSDVGLTIQGNPTYCPTPTLFSSLDHLSVGRRFVFKPLEGDMFQRGRAIITTPVTQINLL